MYHTIFAMLQKEFSSKNAFQYLEELSRFHRVQCSPGLRSAAQLCQRWLQKAGLNSSISHYPADGETSYFTYTMPQEWSIEEASLYLCSKEGEEKLLSFEDCELSVAQRSSSTPPQGLKGPFVVIENAHQKENYAGLDIRGKWILTDQRPSTVKQWAICHGALGILTDARGEQLSPRDAKDLGDIHQYHALWGASEKENAVAFVLTPNQGKRLRLLAKRGEEVLLKGMVRSSFYQGSSENVTASIEGETTEEILLLAHLCHPRPSANDNASGVAALLEVARSLSYLIRNQALKRPRRTIRFLLMPEMTGTYNYLCDSTTALDRTLMALNLDMVGGIQDHGGGALSVERPPLAIASFGQELLEEMLKRSFNSSSNVGKSFQFPSFRAQMMPFSGGSDHSILNDPSIGIPCPMLIQWPERSYHTCADTPERIDASALKRAGLLAGVYAYFMANGEEREASWLMDRVVEHFASHLSCDVGKLLDTTGEEAFSLDQIKEYIVFRSDRKEKDLQSLQSLAASHRLADRVLHGIKKIETIAETQIARVDDYCKLLREGRAEKVGRDRLKDPIEHRELKRIRPKRLFFGPIDSRSLMKKCAALPIERQEAFNQLEREHKKGITTGLYSVYLQYWMDGERTLEEIVRLIDLETGTSDIGYALEYCYLLEEMGYISFNSSTPQQEVVEE